jgi:pimeloyl-ACP methyl ester carboxylesterase
MQIEAGVLAVPVEGGRLVAEVLPGRSEPVVCIHGISSQRRLWGWLRAEAPELTLVAPDLRGRGDSFEIAGASSLGRHASDVLAVLDELDLGTAHLCGMSMGGFVAVELAARHPDRVASVTLVDGGFPMRPPTGLDRDSIRQVFAGRFGRLDRRWESLDQYRSYFLSTTAPLLDPSDPVLDAYLSHDLREGFVRLSADAVATDAADVFFGAPRWAEVTAPIHFLHAEWSVGRDTPPAYPLETVAEYRPRTRSTTALQGLDHAGSIMTRRGAAATAAALGRALTAT